MGKHSDNKKFRRENKTKNSKSELYIGDIQKEAESKNEEEIKYENTYHDSKTVVKIPVVLAEKMIEIEVDALIELKEFALEIKNIDRNIFLTENNFIPIVIEAEEGRIEKGKLFLNGFIRKSIAYSTVKSIDDKGIYGELHHVTVNIPFKSVTEIEYTFQPIIYKNNKMEKIEIYKLEGNNRNEEERKIFKEIDYELSEESEEIFTEPIFCELEKAKICEVNQYMDKKPIGEKFPLESVFQIVKEKLILSLTVKIFQKQLVDINYIPKNL